jgi:hypothetical protein
MESLRQQLYFLDGLGRMKRMNDQIRVLDNAYKTAENESLGYDAENVEYVQSATIPGSNVHDVPAQIPFGAKRSRTE